MKIEYKTGIGEYPSLSESSGVLSIGDITIDMENDRRDSEVVMDFKDGDTFKANVFLPPNTYTMVDTGEVDEEGHVIIAPQLDPLNKARVRVVVWPKHEVENNIEE